MAPEAVRLHTRDKRVVDATAEITRYGAAVRILRGGAIAVVAIVIGAVTILIPVLHFVLPWAIPLAGFGVGAYVALQGVIVGEVRATCPDCSAAIAAPGGTASEDVWIRCPKCTLPLRLEILG